MTRNDALQTKEKKRGVYMKEYSFDELGYFTAGQMHKLAAVMTGKTYMGFKVGYSNQTGNCTLIIMTDYEADEKEIKAMFLHTALAELARLA